MPKTAKTATWYNDNAGDIHSHTFEAVPANLTKKMAKKGKGTDEDGTAIPNGCNSCHDDDDYGAARWKRWKKAGGGQYTPVGKLAVTDDSYIRKEALKRRIPCMHTVAAAKAAAEGIAARREGHGGPAFYLRNTGADLGCVGKDLGHPCRIGDAAQRRLGLGEMPGPRTGPKRQIG